MAWTSASEMAFMLENACDEALFAAACKGSEDALEQLLERNWNAAYHIARSFVREAALAEDLAQEACLGLLKAAEEGRAVRDFASWFRGLVANKARTAMRSRQRRRRREERAARPEGARDKRSELCELTEGLPQKLRQPMELHFGLGLTYAEVARLLQHPEGTIASRVRAGLSRLRKSFELRGVHLSLAAIGELSGEVLASRPAPPRPSAEALRVLARRGAWLGGRVALVYSGVAALGLAAIFGLGAVLWPEAAPSLQQEAALPPQARRRAEAAERRSRTAKSSPLRRARGKSEAESPGLAKDPGRAPAVLAAPGGNEGGGAAPPAAPPGTKAAPESSGSQPESPQTEGVQELELKPGDRFSGAGVSKLIPSPDGQFMLALGSPSRLWGRDGRCYAAPEELAAQDGALLRDGRTLVAKEFSIYHFWDWRGTWFERKRTLVPEGPRHHSGNGIGGVLSDDRLVFPSSREAAPIITQASGGQRRVFDAELLTTVAAVNAEGTRLVCYDQGEGLSLVVWDTVKEAPLQRLPLISESELREQTRKKGWQSPARRLRTLKRRLIPYQLAIAGDRLFYFNSVRIRSWDLTTGREEASVDLRRSDKDTRIPGILWPALERGELLLSRGGFVEVLDIDSLELRRSFRAHHGPIRRMALFADEKAVVTVGEDKTLRFWQLDAAPEEPKIEEHSALVRSVEYAPDGRRMISRDELGIAILRDAEAAPIKAFAGAHAVRFAEKAVLVFRGEPGGGLFVERVDPASGETIAAPALVSRSFEGSYWRFAGPRAAAKLGLPASVYRLTGVGRRGPAPRMGPGFLFGYDGLGDSSHPVVWAGRRGALRVYELATGDEVASFDTSAIDEVLAMKLSLAMHREAGLVLAYSGGGSGVWAWELSGEALWSTRELFGLALSPDGGLLLGYRVQYGPERGLQRELKGLIPLLVEARSGEVLDRGPLQEGAITAGAIAPGGGRYTLALGYDLRVFKR